MKTIISEKNEACQKAAERIVQLLAEKSDACLAFSAADLPDGFFDALTELYITGKADFSRARFFSTGEFVPGDKLGKKLLDRFLLRVNADKEKCFLLNDEIYGEYDGIIASCGGLDMIVSGLGDNGEIIFNEPGTPFSSRTHIQSLTDSFRCQFAELFEKPEDIPEKAMTLGIKSVTDAKEIIVLAFGEGKANAVHKMLYARNDAAVPAAFLQIPAAVSVYADPTAAGKL